VRRKLPLSGGAVAAREIAGMRAIVAELAKRGEAGFGASAAILGEAVDALERATAYLRDALGADLDSALAGASAYLKLFGLALGGACLAKAGLAAQDLAAQGDETQRGRIGLARFFAEKLATAAPGLARSILSGTDALEPYEAILTETA
jgi:hypothetical protein